MCKLVLKICCGLTFLSALCAAIALAQTPAIKRSPESSAAVSVDNSKGSASDQSGAAKASKTKGGKTNAAKANPGKAGNANANADANGKALPGITPEREAAVMTFVQRHHPELTELLIHLKENTPKEYDRAVRDLLRTSERLAQIQERDVLAYELELQLWQARSRAQLLAARLQMSESEELRKQLRAALNEECDLRLQLLQRDREKVADRMKHLQEQIDKLSQRRDDDIEKQMKQLTAAARGGEVKTKPETKKRPENNKPENNKPENNNKK